MPKIVFAHTDDASVSVFPSVEGVVAHGPIQSRGIITAENRPLQLWQHDAPAGARLTLERPPVGHAFYVLGGSIECDDTPVEEGGAVLAEHLCSASLTAGAAGASLLHFHSSDGSPTAAGAGGSVHVAGKAGQLRIGNIPGTHLEEGHSYLGTLWSELDCPTCQLWLYRSDLGGPVSQKGSLHYHSTDEIIFILDGQMLMGTRSLTAGAALAIDATARYRVGVGEPGVSFLNFRAQHSFVVMVEQGDKRPMDERDTWRKGTAVV